MRKKYISIAILIAFIGIINFFDDVKGIVVPNLILFDTDKDTYYIDEEIIINASWELNYDNSTELSFVQVRIFHENGTLLWNSPKYFDIGVFQNDWTVRISELNVTFENSSIILSVQFYVYWDHFVPPYCGGANLGEILIEINKRDISCQLIGFPNVLKYGDVLSFRARFYDSLLNNSNYLVDQIIECKIISLNICWLKKNFTINSSGIIEVNFNILNISHNFNYLIFTIKGNEYYSDSEFEYEIIIEVVPIDNGNINPIPFNFLLFVPIPFLLLIIILFNKNKKSKHRKLSDITIKY